ncbi:MAG: hypothetical protein AB1894_02910 [Chloroflexota bacterium]
MSKPYEAKTKSESAACSCPVCLGLDNLERPRYFAGQLLTEAELNSEQAYVRAKNRLHNRYLHGWGVVCGLEVVCHECEGYITVRPGYALDPCGEDIVVGQEQEINVIEMIAQCKDSRRRRSRDDCDPLSYHPDVECKDQEEHWCLTLSYREQETNPVAVLRRSSKTSVTASSCGGNGGGCGSSDSKYASHSQSATCNTGIQSAGGACETTRIYEGFAFDLICDPKQHCRIRPLSVKTTSLEFYPGLARYAKRFPPQLLQGYAMLLELKKYIPGTLLDRLLCCILPILDSAARRMKEESLDIIVAILGGDISKIDVNNEQIYNACCQFRKVISDLYQENPSGVHCRLPMEFAKLQCIQPGEDQEQAAYLAMITPVFNGLAAMLFQYIQDCVCLALLPPCPPDPAGERLVLACLTIKNGKIIDICNFDCRRYAGSFPAVSYWLSALPISPLIHYALQQVCCMRWPDQKEAVPAIAEAQPAVQPEVGSNLYRLLARDQFSNLRMASSQVENLMRNFSLENLAARIRPVGTINLEEMLVKTPNQANKALTEAGVRVVERRVASAEEALDMEKLADLKAVAPGENVLLYRTGKRVIGFRRYGVQEELADKESELKTIRSEMEELRNSFSSLRSRLDDAAGNPEG